MRRYAEARISYTDLIYFNAYVIGEPMSGRLIVPKSRIHATYDFTGFFMVIGKHGG